MAVNAHFKITAEDKTAAAFNAVLGQFSKLESTLRGLKNLAFDTIIGAGIAELTRKIYDATTQWQSWQYTLEGAGLSTEETAQQLDFLKNTSLELGLSIKDVGQAFGRFILTGKAAGMQIGEMDQDFKDVSEAMRVFHLDGQRAQRSWIALTEVMAMGTLHSRQFTQQLGRDWPGIGALIAQAMYPGENSLKRFMDDMEHGKISSQAFMDAFQKVMATPAMQGALADAEDSLQASTGRLSTAFFDLFNQADNPSLSNATGAIDDLSKVISDPGIKAGFDSLAAGLAEAAKWAAEGAGKITDFLSALAQWSAHIDGFYGGAADQVKHLRAENKALIEELNHPKIMGFLPAHNNAATIASIKAQIAANEAMINALMPYTQAPASSGAKSPTAASGPVSTGYTNEAGTPIPEDLAKMIYGPTGHKDTMQPWLARTKIDLPKALQAAQPIKLPQIKPTESPSQAAAQELVKELTKKGLVATKEEEAALKQMFQTGEISAQQYQAALLRLKETTDANFKAIQTLGEQMGASLENSMAKVFDSIGKRGTSLKNILHDLFASIARDASDALAKIAMNKMFGSFDDSGAGSGTAGFAAMFASLFGGAHAQGGDAPGGKISLVGERGPELFVPQTTGSIIPNNVLSRWSGQTNTNVNIDARGAGPDEVAKLLAMRNEIINTVKGNTEFRLQRGSWRTTGATA